MGNSLPAVRGINHKYIVVEEVEIILRFIRAQKEPIRSLLILRLIDEEAFGTIANILNKTDVWCRVTFYRMKRKIIDLLAQE